MQTNPGVTRSWEARHPQFMKPRDALISFQCSLPDLVQVSEMIYGESIHTQNGATTSRCRDQNGNEVYVLRRRGRNRKETGHLRPFLLFQGLLSGALAPTSLEGIAE